MKPFFTFVIVVLAVGRALPGQVAPSITSLDSVALERTACFGFCPAYRLTLTRSGAVRFVSRNRRDGGHTESDSIAPQHVAALLPAADSMELFSLPPISTESPGICANYATDHPTVTVSFFGSGQLRQIVDHQGCYPRMDSTGARLRNLRRFERLIDSVAGSRRWVRANR